jgi:hypothetical protein
MRRSLLSRLGIVTAVLALTLPGGVVRADPGPGYATAACWQRFAPPAEPLVTRLAHGGDGSLWAVLLFGGVAQVGRWNGSGWTTFPGVFPVGLAVTPAGQPWVTDLGNIYRLVGTTWEQVPGQAAFLDIGQFGDIWKTGPERIDIGYSLYQWSGTGWIPIEAPPRPHAAGDVSVDLYGTPWTSNLDKIYRRKRGLNGGTWIDVGTAGQVTADLDIGGPLNGEQVWRIVREGPFVDWPIQRWNVNSGWVYVEGAGHTVSVDRDGRAWHINSRKEIYFWVCA